MALLTRRRARVVVAGALAVGAGLVATPPASAQELLVSAAVSMRDAVAELGRAFTSGRPGVTVRFNFGASGELQKQIEAGAPVDVFISAGQRQMDELAKRALILPGSRRVFARNTLAVIKPADSSIDLVRPADLLDPRVRRIAIGNPRTVPVGQYTEESLRALGLWHRLQPRLVLAENVRQALDYVARGEVDVGFVYATDVAVRRDRVREAFRMPEDTHTPVTYPAAVVRDSRHPALGQAFVDGLLAPEGRTILERLGFQPPPVGVR